MKTNLCETCGKDASGFKCANCGTESGNLPVSCDCGDVHHNLKCTGCSEASSKCTCSF